MPRRATLLTCLGCLLTASLLAPAAPPELNIPRTSLENRLTDSDVEAIRKRLKYWTKLLREADDVETVVRARRGILYDYRRYDVNRYAEYGIVFAREAAGIVTDALGDVEKLRTVKHVNVAIALAEMEHVTIQPALETMVAHANTAVRYLGWKTYRGVWPNVIGQGQKPAKQYWDSLRARAAEETSPMVLGEIFGALTLPENRPTLLQESQFSDAQVQVLGILDAAWKKRCKQVAAGQVERIGAMRSGLDAVASVAGAFSAQFPQGRQRRATAYQMLVDAAWCAASAYDDADATGEAARAAETLLVRAERTLNALRGTDHEFIRLPLRSNEVVERGAAVKFYLVDGKTYGVEGWIQQLKEFGVTEPGADDAETQPATRPDED